MTMVDDPRAIDSIWLKEGDVLYKVNGKTVTRIESYRELGDSGYSLWFNIWMFEKITNRVNGKFVEQVRYQ